VESVVLVRGASHDDGTLGMLFVGGQFFCRSIELPDRGNQRGVSRIPAGEYLCKWHRSPRFGWVYLVTGVPGRSDILIHPANWAGDKAMGFRSDLLGCIALGLQVGTLAGQRAVLASRAACGRFFTRMAAADFALVIVETDDV
jgi:hypothetical protein